MTTDGELDRKLAEVDMKVTPMSLSVRVDGGPEQNYSLRVIVPATTDWPEKAMSNGWWKRGDPYLNLHAHRLLQMADLTSLRNRRNERKLDFSRLARSVEFREIRQTLRAEGGTADLALSLFVDTSDTVEELLERARYPVPLPALPIDREGYEEFRETVLGEVEEFSEQLRIECLKHPDANDQVVRAAMDLVRQPLLRRIVLTTARRDRDEGIVLQPLAERADALLQEAHRRSLRHPRTPLRRYFDWNQVRALLADAIDALRKLQRGTSEIEGLTRVLAFGTIFERADAVLHIWRSLRDRSVLFAHVLREVDCAMAYVLGATCREVYRRIRSHLSQEERRLFLLMYLPHFPRFGGPGPSVHLGGVPWVMDPVLHGILSDDRLVVLVVLVLAFRVKTLDGEDLSAQLEQRVKAYLAFYTYWLGMTRATDSERRKGRRLRARLRLRNGLDIERVPDRSSAPTVDGSWASLLNVLHESGDVSAALSALGLEDPRGICQMRWGAGLKQKEIAQRLGISQQRVSVQLRSAQQRLEDGVKKHGLAAGRLRLQRRKWSLRA